ncbi:MAG: endonuclease MutS2 [Flavobacterium sp.]
MIQISPKTLQDLEFETVLQQISAYANTSLGKENVLKITPISEANILIELQKTSEYLASFSNENFIPNHGFEDLTKEIQFLAIDNSCLDAESFSKILHLVQTCNVLMIFLQKFEVYYPNLAFSCASIERNKTIPEYILNIFDKFGTIKDQASIDLAHIRKQMQIIKGKLNASFMIALQHYNSMGFLDEIKESVIDNKRVLAVTAMYRRKVKGAALSASKSGSIVFIEPEQTHQLTRELQNLEFEEREEIIKILTVLSAKIRPYSSLLLEYQEFLAAIDVIAAKAKYARKINGILPEITQERKIYFRDALHPILFLNNLEKKLPTYSQTIELHQENRIIVISGPNAGGKTISLKTIGLLQLMLQSGILIPVHERSSTFLFDRILTDIGDNQSIENHLSTYSYRLKNMNYFLKKCNAKTLFLIDEFGTGSDPEMGGALAETFLEEFYHREAFGIITTHYTNLKLLAGELPFMSNANMLFDEKSLEPKYKLLLGQPGSSFTFEVAQKMGIPFGLINRAKKKIEKGKVRFDKTILTLQKERNKLEKTSEILKDEEQQAREERQKMENINAKIKDKLEKYQELYDSNQRIIYLGQKIDDLSLTYFNNKDRKVLIGEFLKLVEIENHKRKKLSVKEQKQQEIIKKEVAAEIKPIVEKIRKEKKEKKIKAEIEKIVPKVVLKIGDTVRMTDGKATGTIEKITKNKATVNYGVFTSQVSLEQLEFVK